MELSRINAIIFLYQGDDRKIFQRVYKECFSYLSLEKKQALLNFIKSRNIENVLIFISQSISLLYKIAFKNYHFPKKSDYINEGDFQNALWDNILLTNTIYFDQAYKHADLHDPLQIWKMGLIQQDYIRQFGNPTLIPQLKTFLFYRFIKEYLKESHKYIKEFLEVMQVKSFFDISLFIFSIFEKSVSQFMDENIVKSVLKLNDVQLKMIAPFSLRQHDIVVKNNGETVSEIHRDIITHPFYLIQKDILVVLDYSFLTYVTDYSLTYNFYNKSRLNVQFKTYSDFKSFLGKYYYEEFFAGQLLSHIFSSKGFRCIPEQDNLLPDFTINHQDKDIVMIEVKATEIMLDTLENADASEFKLSIERQFLSSKTNSSRDKGAFQLLRQIKDFFNSDKLDALLENSNRKKNSTIYPVIFYKENVFDIPHVNAYVSSSIAVEVAELKAHCKQIYPITMININFLIEHYCELKKKPWLLLDWIKQYQKRISSNKASYEHSNNPKQYLLSGISFSNFLRSFPNTSNNIDNFSMIMEDLNLSKE